MKWWPPCEPCPSWHASVGTAPKSPARQQMSCKQLPVSQTKQWGGRLARVRCHLRVLTIMLTAIVTIITKIMLVTVCCTTTISYCSSRNAFQHRLTACTDSYCLPRRFVLYDGAVCGCGSTSSTSMESGFMPLFDWVNPPAMLNHWYNTGK